jgi:hypothetical protein
MINSNGNLTILVHAHYSCPICFEAQSRFDNFEVHGGQYCCPICFEEPSGINNFEVLGQYSCPFCFEAPSGVDNIEVHVHYCCPIFYEAKIFVIFVTFRKLFLRKAKINFLRIFAKIRKPTFFLSTLTSGI